MFETFWISLGICLVKCPLQRQMLILGIQLCNSLVLGLVIKIFCKNIFFLVLITHFCRSSYPVSDIQRASLYVLSASNLESCWMFAGRSWLSRKTDICRSFRAIFITVSVRLIQLSLLLVIFKLLLLKNRKKYMFCLHLIIIVICKCKKHWLFNKSSIEVLKWESNNCKLAWILT